MDRPGVVLGFASRLNCAPHGACEAIVCVNVRRFVGPGVGGNRSIAMPQDCSHLDDPMPAVLPRLNPFALGCAYRALAYLISTAPNVAFTYRFQTNKCHMAVRVSR